MDDLASRLGPDAVRSDAETRAVFASDLLYDGIPPVCIVSPASVEALGDAVTLITRADCAVVPRGGGLSYSAGYVADRPDAVMIDTRRLDAITEINTEDLYVTVEAGVTWTALNEALAPHGVRTPFWGTGSGKFATVGATLAQNAVNYGSGQYGLAAQSVVGLEVVTADGSVIVTGSGGNDVNPSPFLRHYGPDLTGLFVGDGGALGIKARATLQLIRRPTVTRYAAFEYKDVKAFCQALSDVARTQVTSECFGFDPGFTAMRTTYAGIKDGMKLLAGVAKAEGSVLGGLKQAASVAAAGTGYLKGIGYSIHITVDGRDEADADSRLAVARAALAPEGKEIEASVPKVMRGTPFPDPTIVLGHKGERWIPMHGIVPHSRLAALFHDLDTFFAERQDKLEKHGIAWCVTSVPAGPSGVLVEPNLYWRDARPPSLPTYFPDGYLEDQPEYPEDLETRAVVKDLRRALAELFRALGGVHLQIGRVYPYFESRSPAVQALLKALKAQLDPKGLMNPGSLGL